MRCPKCHKSTWYPGFKLKESDNFNGSLPTNWFKGNKLYWCENCALYILILKDDSVYQYNSKKNCWEKIKGTVRKVSKSQIIGGEFVQ
jgi:hypothetical protein